MDHLTSFYLIRSNIHIYNHYIVEGVSIEDAKSHFRMKTHMDCYDRLCGRPGPDFVVIGVYGSVSQAIDGLNKYKILRKNESWDIIG